MKAKRYYIPFLPTADWEAPGLSTTKDDPEHIEVYVLPTSALSKVIERAAKAAYESYLDRLFGVDKTHSTSGYPRWVKWRRAPLGHEDTAHLYPETKLYWRQIVSAAYEAGGFES